MTPLLTARLRGAAMVFFDGTLWRNDEMHEVMRCHYGRPLAALVVGQPVR